jgi:hypothetical protein
VGHLNHFYYEAHLLKYPYPVGADIPPFRQPCSMYRKLPLTTIGLLQLTAPSSAFLLSC